MCYAGLQFDITIEIVATVAVPSVILCISSLVLYELWAKNGISNAKVEPEYIELTAKYKAAAAHLNSETMQEFIVAEKQRRYNVEYERLTNEINKTELTISALSHEENVSNWTKKINKVRLKLNKKRYNKLCTKRDTIVIDMPYTYAEQFDELQYNAADYKFKEYKPGDAAKFMSKKRGSKYVWTITLTLVGLNVISPTIGGQHWLIAMFMTLLAAISLLISIVTGYSTGYNSVAVYNTGIYETALLFIDKAKAYCIKYNRELYYKVEAVNDIPDEVKKPEETSGKIDMSIFNISEKKVE